MCAKSFLVALGLAFLFGCSPQDGAKTDAQPTEAAPAVEIPAGDYTLDKSHASLIFRVNHLGFSHFTGRFAHFDAKLHFDPATPVASHVEASIVTSGFEVDNPPEGFLESLRGAEWLDAEKYPEISFRSTSVEITGANTANVTGDLMLHGATHPVVLAMTYNGGYAGHPMDPHARIGFSARGTLKRSAFGIAFGIPEPGSNMGVGDDVAVEIEAEFNGPAWTNPLRSPQ